MKIRKIIIAVLIINILGIVLECCFISHILEIKQVYRSKRDNCPYYSSEVIESIKEVTSNDN